MKKQLVIAISGVKNSGKTTVIENIIPILKQKYGLVVSTIKHDGHDFIPDVPFTDTFKHSESGAHGVAIFSENRFMVTLKAKVSEKEILSFFESSDIVILEGFKNSDYKKLEIIRKCNSEKPVCNKNLVGLVSDIDFKVDVPVFGLDDYEGIAECIKGLYNEL